MVQSTCFGLSSFYWFMRNHFFSKCSNHLSIDIEVLYFYFHCWPTKVFWMNRIRLSFRYSGLTAVCIAWNPYNDCFFADTRPYVGLTLKFFSSLKLFTVLFLWMESMHICNPAIFSVSHRSNVCPFLWGLVRRLSRYQIFSIQIDWFR